MLKLSSTLTVLSLFLIACGSTPIVEVGGTTLNYDSGTWEYFSNESTSGLNVKGDESCWIDLSGDLTTPLASEGLEPVENDGMTYYFASGASDASYVSFDVGSESLFGRISVENPGECTANFMDLAAVN